jgi:hypothetical protein
MRWSGRKGMMLISEKDSLTDGKSWQRGGCQGQEEDGEQLHIGGVMLCEAEACLFERLYLGQEDLERSF